MDTTNRNITTYSKELSLDDMVMRHRDAESCARACKACRNYGRIWACPPFSYEPLDRISRYSRATVFADKIEISGRVPVSGLGPVLSEYKTVIRNRLLDLEKSTGGMACILAGECHECDPLPCTRAEGRECRHPDTTRPSLEAYGFNLSSLISDLFGLSFVWSDDGFAPPYLILVTALFHD